jgi:RNA polymerase sigma-70 factor (ECF subfamily)
MTEQRAGPAPAGGADDAALVRRSLEGAPEACEALVRRYERPIYNLIVRLVRDPATAEDLAQDTFLKMFRALDTYDSRYRFSSWLFRIAHNTAVDYLRQRRLLIASPTVDEDGEEHDPVDRLADTDGPSPERQVLRQELVAALDEAIDRLRPDYRAAVVLRYQEGLDYQEIAQVMDLPLGTVKTYLHRARRELARDLSPTPWGLKPGSGDGRKA